MGSATANTLPVFRTIPDVAKALDGLSDAEALALIERRRAAAGGGAGDVSVKQAEFEVLDVPTGTRGRDEPDSQFFAEALPRSAMDSGGKPALNLIERVVLVPRLREVMALVGFTRFEPWGLEAAPAEAAE